MSGAELIAAIATAEDRAERQRLLERLVESFANAPEFPVLLRKLKPPQRLYAVARALDAVPDEPGRIKPILAAATRGLGKSRTLQRLLELQSRVEKCTALDAAVAAAEKRTKLKCPKCAAKLPRPTLIRHLWFKHRLVFEKGRARPPGPLIEKAIAAAVASDDAADIGRVYELASICYRTVEPAQIHQALVARIEVDPEELEPLRQRAKESNAGLCPRCAGPVASPVPPLPPPLVVSHGRLSGEGFALDLGPVSAGRRKAIRWGLAIAALGFAATLLIPSRVVSPLIVFGIVLMLTIVIYRLVKSQHTSNLKMDDAVVDAAWSELVPFVGRSAAAVTFLTRLCRSSLDHGTTENRTDAVWGQVEQAAVLSGKGGTHLQWFAAVRVLQAYDAGQIGQDWIPSLLGILAPLFRAEASPAYAEAVAETLLQSDALADRDGARLRVALVGEAFAAGLTPSDLAALVEACPNLDRLFAGDEAWFRALHAVWRERNRRSWDKIGSAKTAFEFAANPAAGTTLAAYPDTLLVFRFDESFDRELGPVLIGRRGVTVAEVTASDLNTEVAIEPGREEGSKLRFGNQTIPCRRKLPKKVATILTSWLQYREELLATERSSYRTERLTSILAPLVAECPLCRQRSLVKVGEVGKAWPLIDV